MSNARFFGAIGKPTEGSYLTNTGWTPNLYPSAL